MSSRVEVVYGGIRKLLTEVVAEAGFQKQYRSIYTRVTVYKWKIERALRYPIRRRNRLIVIGSKFNKLTILKETGNRMVLCVCECGTRKIIKFNDVEGGRIKSCGCMLNSDNRTWSKKKKKYETSSHL